MFLGLITRCKDEPFIEEFCDYYLSQGVDLIFILDDNSNDKSIYKNLLNNKKVNILICNNIFKEITNQMFYVNKVYQKIRNNFQWLISVDVDEFITTRKNFNKTIKEELQTTFKNADCVKVPWVMVSSNGLEKNPKSLLETNVFRWDHDKKHPNKNKKFRCRYNEIEVKCIFKTRKFNKIAVHIPKEAVKRVNIVDSISNLKSQLNPFYNNLRESKIENSFLICYHYRVVSKEHTINKLKNSNLYKKKQINFKDINSSDHAEIEDITMREKRKLFITCDNSHNSQQTI